MALTSPWNVAFWLAAMGRPELSGAKPGALLIVAGAVIAGALTWGVLWAASNALLHRSLEGAAKRWWTIGVDLGDRRADALFRGVLGETADGIIARRRPESD